MFAVVVSKSTRNSVINFTRGSHPGLPTPAMQLHFQAGKFDLTREKRFYNFFKRWNVCGRPQIRLYYFEKFTVFALFLTGIK
jgi:hypothetical protein